MLLLLVAFAPIGCSYPKAVHTFEYLTRYERMTDRYDPLVSLVYLPDGVELAPYRAMILEEVTVGKRWVESPEEAESYATFFRYVLRDELNKVEGVELATLDADLLERLSGEIPVLRLEGKITRFYLGSGWQRFFLSRGASDLQFEGRLTDARTGRLLMEFADRRRHLGNTPFGPYYRTFSHEFVMKVTMRETAECLARFVQQLYPGLPAVPQPSDDL